MASLSGIRVLDLSRVLAGPWAGQTLGDLGAEVIKVERVGSGDDTRAWGPPWVDKDLGGSRRSAYFASANRNKKSIAIDFTSEAGKQLIYELVSTSDILIENFKAGSLKQYGLDYESLKKINPRLIYCSITGFGQTGPYADRPGYDFLIQGLGGLMSVTGRPESEPGGGPIKVGVALTDILTGLYGVIGILSALNYRNETGEGQYVDMALLDVQVACLANQAMNYLSSGIEPKKMGNAHPNIVPYQDFPTSDGYVIVTVGNDGQFMKFCECLGIPHLARDPKFLSNSMRIQNRVELAAIITKIMKGKSSAEWLSVLESAGVPCGPINGLSRVFDDPQVVSRKLMQEFSSDGIDGGMKFVTNPIRLSKTPVEYKRPPPMLGESTKDVLMNILGLSEDRIEQLSKEKVIGLRV